MKKILIAVFVLCCLFGKGSQMVLSQTVQPQLFAPGVVSTEFMETSAAFTPDGKTVYFTRADFQFSDNTIMESHFKGGKWTKPEVASFSGVWRDSEPHVSPDGTKLFFVSNRPATGDKPLLANFSGRSFPGANIWYVEKKQKAGANPFTLMARLTLYRPFTILRSLKTARFTFPVCFPTAKAKTRFTARF